MSSHDARIDAVAGTANTWIVGNDEEVIVVDPGEDAPPVLAAVGDREIMAVICTHGHAAHASAAVAVADRDEAPVALHPADRPFWRELHDDDPEIAMEDGGRFEVAGVALEVLHAPGHSRGSVVLFCEELARHSPAMSSRRPARCRTTTATRTGDASSTPSAPRC